MATSKNTADLLAQAAANLPDNTTQQISPQDVREMDENIAVSSYNKITDSALVGLKQHNVLPTYESGQGCINGGQVYISNKITGPGVFAAADWDLYAALSAADKAKIDFLTVTQSVDLDTLESDTATNNAKLTADSTNVDAAGAVMNTDATTAAMSFVIDEDNMVSDSDTKIPTQQSVKAYVDTTTASAKAYQGGYNANTNTPDLDTTPIAGIEAGDVYDVTAAGSFFGSVDLEIGDTITANQASPTTAAHWVVTQANLTPASIKTQYESNSDTNAYTDAEATKVGFISVTQSVDLDTIESDTATNNAKVSNVSTDLSEGTATNTTVDVNSSDGTNATLAAASTSRAGVMTKANFDAVTANTAKISNATHTSEVTGATALTVAPIAVSNKALITATGTMELLVNDGGTLKKVVASDFLGGGATEVGTGTGSLQKIGDGSTASGDYSIALGRNSQATTLGAVAIGDNADATVGTYNIAIGKNVNASGGSSAIAMGESNTANNTYAVAIGGFSNQATQLYATNIGGRTCIASGLYSSSIGGQTCNATAQYSATLGGHNSVASGDYSAVLGGSSGNTNFLTRAIVLGGTTIIADRADTVFATQFTAVGGQTILKGAGTTSGTTALLVENSAGTDILECRDDNAIGFYGTTPVVQGTALTAQLTTITQAGSFTPDYALQAVTNTTPYGFVTADEAETFISVVENLQARVAELEARLDSTTGNGLIA
jgi:hypothetical protein